MRSLPPLRIVIPSSIILIIFSYTLLDTLYFTTPTLPISSFFPSAAPKLQPLLPHSYHSSSSSNNNITATSFERQNDHRLTHQQCLDTYPRLYHEADRARKYYHERKGIRLEDVDEAERNSAAARIIIKDNQLYVRAFYGGINTRAYAVLANIWRTLLTSPEGLPDVDLVFQVNDAGDGNEAVFALCRKESQPGLWLMPDFGFFSWPEPMRAGSGSYSEIRSKALEREFELELLGLGLRSEMSGSSSDEKGRESNGEEESKEEKQILREKMEDFPLDERREKVRKRRGERAGLMEEDFVEEKFGSEGEGGEAKIGADINEEMDQQPKSWRAKVGKLFWRGVPMVDIRQQLFRATEGQAWSDVRDVDWGNVNDGRLTSLADHCDYKYLAHVEGWAYSGRLKFIQMCRSVIITHPLQYIQHYHHLFNTDPLSPLQNMIEVPTPLEENLPGVMEELLKDEERGERIASNSWREFREGYISPAANECYFRYAINAYASVQQFTPSIGDAVSYESFLLTGQTHWEPHR